MLAFMLLYRPTYFLPKLTATSNNGGSNSLPIGYIIGPGLAIGNMLAAGSANDTFNRELLKYELNGIIIKIKKQFTVW